MSNNIKEVQELISLINTSLRRKEIIASSTYNSEINYDILYNIAKRNSVVSTVADVICTRNGISDDIKKKFQKQKSIIIAQQALCDIALAELYTRLEERKTKGLFFKGTLLKKLYPKTYMRSMSDIDVFAAESDIDAIHSLMTELGYKTGTIGYDNHYEYMRQTVVKVEYHPELVALESEYGKKVFQRIHPEANNIASYMNIWDHTIPIKGNEYSRQFVPEYHYLYVIMHMMNHFLAAGTGIRSIMDVWVMNHHYGAVWNRELIEHLLKDYGLSIFEKYALALANKWFDLGILTYLPTDVKPEILEQYEQYILESGTYGTTEHSVYKQMNHQTSGVAKIKYLAGRFFLPYKQMKAIYPIVGKYPVTLPVMWCHRVFDMFQVRGIQTRSKIQLVTKANHNKADSQKELMEAMIGDL